MTIRFAIMCKGRVKARDLSFRQASRIYRNLTRRGIEARILPY